MKSYTLTLISGQTNDFTVSLNGTALTTAQFNSTFFSAAGIARFTFDTSVTNFTIWDSSAMSGRSVAGTATIDSTKSYDVEWASASGQTTNTFTSVVESGGYAMTKYQISDLMNKIKLAGNAKTVNITANTTLGNLIRNGKVTGSGIYNFQYTGVSSSTERVSYVTGTWSSSLAADDYTLATFSSAASRSKATVFLWMSDDYYNAAINNSTTGLTANERQVAFIVIDGQTQSYGGYSCFGWAYRSGTVWSKTTYSLWGLSTPATNSASSFSQDGAYRLLSFMGGEQYSYSSQAPTYRAWTTIGTSSKYNKRALQVTVNINETSLALTANDWNTLFTLPANYYPNSEIVTGCTMNDNGTLVNGLVKITTAGAVQVMAGSNTTEVYGLLTIPVAS